MKSKDLQKLVLSKYNIGQGPAEIFQHLNGAVSLITIKRWCKMICESGAIQLSTSSGRPRTIRTKQSIQKVKQRLTRKKKISTRKLALELDISRTSVRRILKDDLHLRSYKKVVEPLLTNEQKAKRKCSNFGCESIRRWQTQRGAPQKEISCASDGLVICLF